MKSDRLQAWFLDQLTKSEFFHQKLHEWRMLPVAKEIGQVRGEELDWDLSALGISETAWKKVIHKGIRPVTVFAHPTVLMTIPGAVGYYRMLSMVSQKSMARIGIPVKVYEAAAVVSDRKTAEKIAYHLNQVIGRLIDLDEEIDSREFDLWRGMAAGTQAQGSWQNAKGVRAETLFWGLIQRRLCEKGWVTVETAERTFKLRDERVVIFGDEPDVAFYKANRIRAAIEIKGGIDPAGVLERLGAALKTLNRVREENPAAVTVLIVQEVSLTPQARNDLDLNRHIITHWFTMEEVLTDNTARHELFEVLGI